MSYILEALKKSEQKRQRDAATDLMTFQTPVTIEPKKRPMLQFLLLVVLLVNAGIFLAWLHPWRTENSTPAVAQTAQKQRTEPSVPVPSVAAVQQAQPLQNKDDEQRKDPAVAQTAQEQRPEPSAPVPSVAAVQQAQPLQNKDEEQRKTLAQPPPTAAKGRPKGRSQTAHGEATAMNHPAAELSNPKQSAGITDGRVLNLNELPVSVLKSLPEIKISLLYYHADSSSRLARINEQTIHEGDVLNGGPKVEEITKSGVIFSYQGYRFRIGAF
ncbi:MAG TPA: hypothetical protein DCP92_01870 [Nitrospiraceae bacterium]|jgi:general secretion pathway protein B|nr:hypothetical protein [Nitrospiraceae bacterium]